MMIFTENQQRCNMYCTCRGSNGGRPLVAVVKEYDKESIGLFFFYVSIVNPFSASLSHTSLRWQIATVDVSRCRRRLLESPRRGHRPRKKPPGIGATPPSRRPDGC